MSPSAEQSAAQRESWRGILRTSAQEVFSIMVGAELTPADAQSPVQSEVTGMVGITGDLPATFTLRCAEKSAVRTAAQIPGIAAEEARLEMPLLYEQELLWLSLDIRK